MGASEPSKIMASLAPASPAVLSRRIFALSLSVAIGLLLIAGTQAQMTCNGLKSGYQGNGCCSQSGSKVDTRYCNKDTSNDYGMALVFCCFRLNNGMTQAYFDQNPGLEESFWGYEQRQVNLGQM